MKRFLLVLALFLPLIPVIAAEVPERELAPNDHSEFRRLVLPNGLRVLLLSDPSVNVSSAALTVEAGSLQDPPDRQGLAHFLEHMLFLGTEKYPDEAEFGNYLQSNGGYTNAYTAEDHTSFHFEIRHEAFEGALDRFAQFFIAPLFTPQFAEREMNAVNSEFQTRSENDAWRLDQVETSFYKADHPANHFAIGNRDTLGGTTHDELLAFYKAHYSANLMSLSLVSNASLDQLEKWARTYFAAVPNQDLPEPHWPTDFLDTKPALRLIREEPITDMRQLSLTFPLPGIRQYWTSKPGDLIGYILGYEGEGSLLSALKAAGLATGLSAGAYEPTADYAMFGINVSLTPEGLDNYQRVLGMVFAAIDDLKKSDFPTALFHERATMARLDETYQDKGEGTARADELANLVREYPLEIAEREPYLWTSEDPTGYRMILDHLSPDNMLVQLAAKGLPTDKTEPRYGTKYSYEEITGPAYAALQNPAAVSAIHLPDPNPFIPQDVAQLPVEPVRLIDEPALSLYYAQDDHFERPQVAEIYRMRLPRSLGTLQNDVLLQFYQACVNEALNETKYTAEMAGLNLGFSADLEGVQLTLGGYNQSAARLLSTATDSLVNFQLSDERFAALKDRLVRSLQSFELGDAWRITLETRRSVVREFYYPAQEEVPVAEKVTLADVRSFVRRLYNAGKIEALVYGNISAADAVAGARQVASALTLRSVADKDLIRRRLLVQPAGDSLVSTEDLKVNNSSFRQEYMLPGSSPEIRAATLVLSNFISDPFYSELRTHQQLGYIVGGYAGEEFNTYFLYFLIQSGEHPADELQQKAEAFIATLPDQFKQLSPEGWQFIVEGARAQLKEEDKTIGGRASRLFGLAYDYDADWARREETLKALDGLTRDRVLEILQQALDPAQMRKRTFLGFSRDHEPTEKITPTFTDRAAWKKKQTYR